MKVFRDVFTTFGVPQEVTTDGGRQFIAHELVLFLEKLGAKHIKSAPYNPHTNLRAETALKSAKLIHQTQNQMVLLIGLVSSEPSYSTETHQSGTWQYLQLRCYSADQLENIYR